MKIKRVSGNIFADLGRPNDEVHLLKVGLVTHPPPAREQAGRDGEAARTVPTRRFTKGLLN